MLQISAESLLVCMFVKIFIDLFVVLVSTPVSFIYSMPQSLAAQRFPDLKVERKSGIGGNIFRARRKSFHG